MAAVANELEYAVRMDSEWTGRRRNATPSGSPTSESGEAGFPPPPSAGRHRRSTPVRPPPSRSHGHARRRMHVRARERETMAEPEKTGLRGLLARYPLISFFTLAMGLSWIAWTPYILG